MSKKCKVVCIGGGSGLSHLVKGLKNLDEIDLKCIVAVSDNGGSSGVLKEELNIPAVGDIRNVLVALSNVPDTLGSLLNYRFESGSLSGHPIGNLLLAGIFQTNDKDIVKALSDLSDIFNVRGRVIPCSTKVADIKAVLENGREVIGEANIGQSFQRIKRIEYISQVDASKEAIQAINEADNIIYSIGSLYTSIIPNLVLTEIREAIRNSNATKIYFKNLMSQPGETDFYTLSDHINAINDHLTFNGIDLVVINDRIPPENILALYKEKSASVVEDDIENIDSSIKIMHQDIAKIENNRIIHCPDKLEKFFKENLTCLLQEM